MNVTLSEQVTTALTQFSTASSLYGLIVRDCDIDLGSGRLPGRRHPAKRGDDSHSPGAKLVKARGKAAVVSGKSKTTI